MLTQAIVVSTVGAPFTLQDVVVRDDDMQDNEVLVEMSATGVCHTDINFRHVDNIEGMFPGVLGHEGAGKVVKIGSAVTNVAPGDHVLITYTHCGKCKKCLEHRTSYCKTWEIDNFAVYRRAYSLPPTQNGGVEEKGAELRSHFFGQSSMAKHAIVMANCLVKVDKDVPLQQLAPLGCGFMTGAGAMLNVVRPNNGSTVVVVGAGAVGLAAIMALKIPTNPIKPSKVIAVDIVPGRLELAKKYGATDVVNSRETTDLAKALRDLTDGEGVDGAIDCTGRTDIVEALIQGCTKRGTVVSVGVGDINAKVGIRVWTYVNSGINYTSSAMGSCYPPEFMPEMIAAWKRGDFPFTELQKEYPAKDIEQAEKAVLDGSVVKAVLVW
ncbi:aryl-alcohol dehydrogenase [Xylogone sp. PMI_703]|nr:aryl-alcohol dehydrogenase [Xylogone sp. PMI_703]